MFGQNDIIDDDKIFENYEYMDLALAEMKILMETAGRLVKRPHQRTGKTTGISIHRILI